jgi:hypothetical protein
MSKREVLIPPRAGLTLPGEITRTSWSLPEGMPFEQWQACGQALVEIEGAVQWWLGDWWTHGERLYGERTKAVQELELNYETVRQYGYVSSHVETGDRSPVLSWKHHLIVAPLTPARQGLPV